ncbi:four helix bundle protein [Chloroflexi bacterium CFX6]|nr:four helix bundle protein [Chloroflexi bacterium CFX6]
MCWRIPLLTLHPSFSKDFKLRDQILDASGSVMHNIAEGCDSGTDPEFIRFLKIARRSGSEVQSELYLALDRKYITDIELKRAYDQADEVKRLINGLIAFLRKSGQNTSGKISEDQGDYSFAPDEDPADQDEEEMDNDQPDEDQTTED